MKPGWTTVALGDLMLRRGGSVNPAAKPDQLFELYSIPAHDRGGFDEVLGSEVGSSKQRVEPGDVMISKIVPHIRRARVVGPRYGPEQIASGEWIVFRTSKIVPEYLRHYLVSDAFHREFMSTVAGVGGSLLRARPAAVANLLLPLPPIEEQHRIAAILDNASSTLLLSKQGIEYESCLIEESFASIFDANARADTTLGELASITSGITKGRRLAPGIESTDVPYLAVSNVKDRYLNLDLVKTMPVSVEERRRYLVKRGDLLLTEGGDPDKLGRGTLWSDELPEVLHQNHIFRVRLKDNSPLTPEYLSWFCASHRARDYFLRSAKQTTGISSINKSQLSALPVIIPTAEQQEHFSEVLRTVSASTNLWKQRVNLVAELLRSLQARAFSGRL